MKFKKLKIGFMEKKEKEIHKTLFKIPVRRYQEEIEIYHDEGYESNSVPFIHQFIVIPVRSREVFYRALESIRKKYSDEGLTVKWDRIKKKTRKRIRIAIEWLNLLSAATYGKPFTYLEGRKPVTTKRALGMKISSVFIDSLNDLSDSFYIGMKTPEEKRRKKYESLMYMGIKGLTSFCFNPEYTAYSRVTITRLCTDGKYGSIPIDTDRIIKKLEWNARNYVEIKTNKIEGIPKSKIKTPEVDFEELTDLVLGGTRYLCGYEERNEIKDKITKPLKDIYDKAKRNKKGREASGHYRSFSVSKCKIGENDSMEFEPLYPVKDNSNDLQGSLNL